MNEKQAKRLRKALGYKPEPIAIRKRKKLPKDWTYKDSVPLGKLIHVRQYRMFKNGQIFCDNPRHSYLVWKRRIVEAKRL